jgi:hypothetical protein
VSSPLQHKDDRLRTCRITSLPPCSRSTLASFVALRTHLLELHERRERGLDGCESVEDAGECGAGCNCMPESPPRLWPPRCGSERFVEMCVRSRVFVGPNSDPVWRRG